MILAAETLNGWSVLLEALKLLAGLLTLGIGGVISYQIAKIKLLQDAQAVAVTQVKKTLVQTTEAQTTHNEEQAKQTADIKQTGEDNKKNGEAVHKLVNSAFTGQLFLTAKYARRVADKTHEPDDIKAAEEAERIYEQHKTANEAAGIS